MFNLVLLWLHFDLLDFIYSFLFGQEDDRRLAVVGIADSVMKNENIFFLIMGGPPENTLL